MKKSELATPAGIDHDYNFLSGIERDLDKSERSVTEKGIDIGPNARSKSDQSQAMDYAFAAAGVKVIRAPKGMSRSKENKTYRSKSGYDDMTKYLPSLKPADFFDRNRNIIWTVELLGPDKTRTLTQSSSVEPIYRLHPLHETSKKKRKRGAEAPTSAEASTVKEASEPQVPESTSAVVESTVAPSTSASAETGQTQKSLTLQKSQADTAEPADQRYNFYLLRPRTSSQRRVLIPLTPSDTLAECIRGCTVEEFPTIYYFPATTDELPEEFMLDEDYRKEEGEQQREFEEMMREVDPEILRRLKNDGAGSKDDEEVDSKRILDVLKQDLGGL